jgi:hypothetical protein
MSNKDPKDTASVTDTWEEDVLSAGLIVGQAASDVLDVTQNKRAANEAKSPSNEVNNGGTTEHFNADTREYVLPAGLIFAQATCDNLHGTEMTSTANEVKNVATIENVDDTISTVATVDMSVVFLDNRQAIVDSEANQLSRVANELGSVGDYRISAEEVVVPQASVQHYSLGVDLQLAASRQETSADDVAVPKKQVEAEPSFKELNSQAIVQARLVKTANRAHLVARSTLVRATDDKKIAFINGTKFKSLTSSKLQATLVAEAWAAAILTDCIVIANKSAQIDSVITTVLMHAKRVAFAAKKRRMEASMAKDDGVLNDLLDYHKYFQLLIKQFITLAERELTICICPPPSIPGYSPPTSPKKKQVSAYSIAQRN